MNKLVSIDQCVETVHLEDQADLLPFPATFERLNNVRCDNLQSFKYLMNKLSHFM